MEYPVVKRFSGFKALLKEDIIEDLWFLKEQIKPLVMTVT